MNSFTTKISDNAVLNTILEVAKNIDSDCIIDEKIKVGHTLLQIEFSSIDNLQTFTSSITEKGIRTDF